MSSAQAAALAAFKGIKNDDKKLFKIPPPTRTYTAPTAAAAKSKQVPRIQTKFASPSPKKPVSISRINTPTTPYAPSKTPVESRAIKTPVESQAIKMPVETRAIRSPIENQSTKSPAESKPRATPNQSLASDAGPSPLDTPRSRQPSVDLYYEVESARSSPVDRVLPKAPKVDKFRKSSSQHSNLSLGSSTSLPQDVIKNLKTSIDSKAIANDQSQKRLSMQYEPSEMIKNIKNSIKSKQMSRVLTTELSLKNQALIDAFRDSVDLKRITHLSQPIGIKDRRVSDFGDHATYDKFFDRASDRTSNRSSIDRPFEKFAFDKPDSNSFDKERSSFENVSSFDRPYRSSFERPDRSSIDRQSSIERPERFSFDRPDRFSFEKDRDFAKAFEKHDSAASVSDIISTRSDQEKSDQSFRKPTFAGNCRQNGDDLAIYQKPIYSNSYSSIGSSILLPPIPSSSPAAPAIVIEHNSSDGGDFLEDATDSKSSRKLGESKEEQKPSDLGDIPENDKLGTLQEAFVKVKLDRNISPITIPPSSNSCARSPNGNSSDNLIHTIPSPNVKLSDSARSFLEEKAKPKRKPPPEMTLDLQPVRPDDLLDKRGVQGTPYLIFSSKSLTSNQDDGYFTDHDFDFIEVIPRSSLDSQRTDNTKTSQALPKFPEGKQKNGDHKHLFKRIHKQKGIDTTVNLLETSGDESEVSRPPIITRASAPILTHQNQPIQLKTTMRKTNKRKEKKYSFNENKPWKNHIDLHYVSEQERKRYEGLWVSNRGNYLNDVVTKLLGVDYDNQEVFRAEREEHSGKEDTDDSRKKISLKAARLSSKADSSNFNDLQNFHNLKSAELNDLMHGIVVKRIWDRSRLPAETLRTIWNLVDFRKDGCLNKAEFLIGMWLVDQCLYGRKLPKKVDDTIWDSLGNIGVNVVVKKKGRR
ncbi:uncharacterized protein CANTADRAFT_26236 [Suhomyces tanzawaensis NRRL Y-17324]|uniref:EH domain-containing protein n=1 Tax=Suhomyces tanzawaensis NRRL Y-17324 TaxID=984487 RepID=A0A1E4SIJ1_9ASCO|nr:uncharacterized protein CANTADRAFT_26236 [Suhomyces tanzawaensis NRRL Y-17324]ODV79252.1 hypothetical protein CANTADRAFT_26236 [Suhomyces tanzawaensis NRRL Y-17324]